MLSVMRKFFIFLALAGLCNTVRGQKELEGKISNCLSGGNDINTCLVNFFNDLRGFMEKGIPEINLPKTDPFSIPRIELNLKNGNQTDVSAVFTENLVTGMKEFNINSIRADRTSGQISFDISIPKLVAKGDYTMRGRVLILDIDSNGNYTTKMINPRIRGYARVTVVNRSDSSRRLSLNGEPEVEVGLQGLNVELANLFNNNTFLSKTVHQFINENPQQFIDDFRPEITKQVKGLMKGFYTGVLDQIDPAVFGL